MYSRTKLLENGISEQILNMLDAPFRNEKDEISFYSNEEKIAILSLVLRQPQGNKIDIVIFSKLLKNLRKYSYEDILKLNIYDYDLYVNGYSARNVEISAIRNDISCINKYTVINAIKEKTKEDDYSAGILYEDFFCKVKNSNKRISNDVIREEELNKYLKKQGYDVPERDKRLNIKLADEFTNTITMYSDEQYTKFIDLLKKISNDKRLLFLTNYEKIVKNEDFFIKRIIPKIFNEKNIFDINFDNYFVDVVFVNDEQKIQLEYKFDAFSFLIDIPLAGSYLTEKISKEIGELSSGETIYSDDTVKIENTVFFRLIINEKIYEYSYTINDDKILIWSTSNKQRNK